MLRPGDFSEEPRREEVGTYINDDFDTETRCWNRKGEPGRKRR